jgi:hypothetical protein
MKYLGDVTGSAECVAYLPLKRDDSEMSEVPFTDYCPQVFRFLRAKWNITDEQFQHSIRGKTEAMLERFTDGRSGSFFYFSEDSKYIVKTLTESGTVCLSVWVCRSALGGGNSRSDVLCCGVV